MAKKKMTRGQATIYNAYT